jgi:hypothetical protein
MTVKTSRELRGELLERQQQIFNALQKSTTGKDMEFYDVDDAGDDGEPKDGAKPLLISEADAIREKSLGAWKTGIGMKNTYVLETKEWLAETDKKIKEDYRYIAGLYANWADEVETILNYDDDELRAKHEEEFGS